MISSSPTDVQPVFQTIAEAPCGWRGALFGSVYRFDGELIHMVAQHDYPRRGSGALPAHLPDST